MSTKRDWTVKQSETGKLDFVIERPNAANPNDPLNAANWKGKLQIRAKESTQSELYHEATTENSEILIGGTNGAVTVSVRIHYTVTTAFTWKEGYYDLFIIDDTDESKCYFEGKVATNSSCTSFLTEP